MAKDRVVFLSTDPDVQDKIVQLAGFSTVHAQPKLPKAKIDSDFWHRPGATLQDTILEDLHLKVDASNVKDIAIVSSKDDSATYKQSETFYVRVQHGDTTYVAVSLNASYDEIKRSHFNFANPNGSIVVQKAIQAKKLMAVVGVDKKLAPVEMVVRAATGAEKPVFMGEGHVLNYLGQQSTEKYDYMPVEKTGAQKENRNNAANATNLANNEALQVKAVPVNVSPPKTVPIKDFSGLLGVKDQFTSDMVKFPTQAITPSNKPVGAEPIAVVKKEKQPLPTFVAKEDVHVFERQILKRLANAIEEHTKGSPVQHVSKTQANVLQRLILLKMAGIDFKNNAAVDYNVLNDTQLFNAIGIEPTKFAIEKLQEKGLLNPELNIVLVGPIDVHSIVDTETKEILKIKDPKKNSFRPPFLHEWFRLAVDKLDFSQESPKFGEDKKQELQTVSNAELAKFFRPVVDEKLAASNNKPVDVVPVSSAYENVNVNWAHCNKLPYSAKVLLTLFEDSDTPKTIEDIVNDLSKKFAGVNKNDIDANVRQVLPAWQKKGMVESARLEPAANSKKRYCLTKHSSTDQAYGFVKRGQYSELTYRNFKDIQKTVPAQATQAGMLPKSTTVSEVLKVNTDEGVSVAQTSQNSIPELETNTDNVGNKALELLPPKPVGQLLEYGQNKIEVTQAQLQIVLGTLFGANVVGLVQAEKLSKAPFVTLVVRD